jgi:hypothetical protein
VLEVFRKSGRISGAWFAIFILIVSFIRIFELWGELLLPRCPRSFVQLGQRRFVRTRFSCTQYFSGFLR